MTTKSKPDKIAVREDGSVIVNNITVSANTIRAIAFNTAGPEMADDASQAMYENLFQRPVTVAQNTPARIKTRMKWAAGHERKKQETYKRHNLTPEDVEDSDGESIDYFEDQPSNCPSPEMILIETVEENEHTAAIRERVNGILDSLPEKTETVARLIMEGYKLKDIAQMMDCCPSSVTRHLKIMRQIAGA